MTHPYALFFFLLLLFSCTPEKEILISGSEDTINPMIGNYTFDLTVNYGSIPPDNTSYLPPKKFTAEVLRSENYGEIKFLNIHDTDICIYAKANGNYIEIPFQNLRLMPEAFGFNMSPDAPDATVFIQGAGKLTEINRTTDATLVPELEIEYEFIYMEETLWKISGHAERKPLSGDIEFTCY